MVYLPQNETELNQKKSRNTQVMQMTPEELEDKNNQDVNIN